VALNGAIFSSQKGLLIEQQFGIKSAAAIHIGASVHIDKKAHNLRTGKTILYKASNK
jgi:hypothetical protein